MKIVPINLKIANAFVSEHHRHHKKCVGCKFCIGLQNENSELIGVAICGRPVSRYYDNGLTLEINRLCTLGERNACSMLYGACIRTAKAMGYHKVITYTLASEPGASLRASNFEYDGVAGGKMWTGDRKRDNGVPQEMKQRWVYKIMGERKMNNIQEFLYENSPIRMIESNGETWWVLSDICKVLDLSTPSKVADRLDLDEKGMTSIHTLGGKQNATIVNESGLYSVILRSDKPEAKAFRR